MKKIIIIFLALLITLSLPAILPAAQKIRTSSSPTYQYNETRTSVLKTSDPNGSSNTSGVTSNELNTIPPGPTSTPTQFTDPVTTASVPPVVTSTPTITADPVTGAIILGSGASGTDGSGALWYGGTSPVGTCNPCNLGVCTFGLGFRAYFEVKFTTPDISANSTAQGDGFSFIIMNAANNDTTERGGSPSSGITMGELIGHAGPGNTTTTSSLATRDGLGLKPPKMAIEFDTYPNTTALTYNGCSGGRADTANNHVSLMLWGLNPGATTMCSASSTAGSSYRQASFDDNVHGAGTAGSTTVPRNSLTGDGTGGYFERAKGASTYNWLEDNQSHRVRIEVIRTSSTQTYQVKTWVDCEAGTTACPASEYVYFQDVYKPYTNSSYLPKINRTVTLSSAYNTMLDNIIFGFTEGTGAATQSIQITNFAIYFPTINISPGSRAHTYSAASGQTVSVTAASGTCTWTAVSNNTSWITVTGGATGTGNGTVTYSISANTGAARTGTITIGGQLFTVTQDAGPPTCTLMASTNIIPYNGTTGLTWTVSGSATSASWTASPGGTCGSPSASGGSCTTAAQTTAGATTFTLNVTNPNGTNSCAATVYVGCQNYQVWNGLGGTRDFRVSAVPTTCRNGIAYPNGQITQPANRLNPPSGTIDAYASAGTCATLLGIQLNYNNAMNADIVANGGDGDCQVNFTGNGTATDR